MTAPVIEAVHGNIVREHVDAIVNAANTTLMGGGGVDGAIHRAAGPKLLEECRRIRKTTYPQGLPVGQAVATGGYDLMARWVIHTVGPNRNRGQTDPGQLASCSISSLVEARRVGARSIAFPAISGGAYGWDMADVARIGTHAVHDHTRDDAGLDLVRFVLFDNDALRVFEHALAEYR